MYTYNLHPHHAPHGYGSNHAFEWQAFGERRPTAKNGRCRLRRMLLSLSEHAGDFRSARLLMPPIIGIWSLPDAGDVAAKNQAQGAQIQPGDYTGCLLQRLSKDALYTPQPASAGGIASNPGDLARVHRWLKQPCGQAALSWR
jgi:hypothetical protein